jgi:hypothetical protein
VIHRLPLDLFDDASADTSIETDRHSHLARCQWCGLMHPAGDVTCPDCGATVPPAEQGSPVEAIERRSPDPRCPWCDVSVAPEEESCPNCDAVLRGDPDLMLPGVNVPLQDNVLWACAMAERELEQDADSDGTIADVLLLVGKALLKTRGRL